MADITSFIGKDMTVQIKNLNRRGGNYQKAADKVKTIIHDIMAGENLNDIFKNLKTTNNGESRIKHVVKYDLSGFCRLVTIHHQSSIILLFCGDHDECDQWLNKNKGLVLTAQDINKGIFNVYKSEDINNQESRLDSENNYADGKLFLKLKNNYQKITENIPMAILKIFEKFETEDNDEEILEAAEAISDKQKGELFFDVFISLKSGNIDEAKNRILLYEEKLKPIHTLDPKEVSDISSNDTYLNIQKLEAEYLKGLISTKDWYDWMIFLHPEQKNIVDKNYASPARLLGVSGSGKTCVLVHRAVRLAEKYQGQQILILTLNKSLSQLIAKLISLLLENLDKKNLNEKIKILSFSELSREMLFELDSENYLFNRGLNVKSDKHNEPVEEIWEEYYQCKLNNDDAKILFPIHQYLLARGIYPQDYLKQEFDWIRSAFPEKDRVDYHKIEREGRYVPIVEEDRKLILEGLNCWEQKMSDIGVIDHLGFTNALFKYYENITSKYRCILVDEVQDFGTLELKIIRKLVEESENDLFICGDIAQQVYNKQHKIKSAGINILPEGFVKILKNYRNSKEILEASYLVFKNNVNIDQLKSDDFEILNPEFANFSSPKPFLRYGSSFNREFSSAYEYLVSILDINNKEKGCIAICGLTISDLTEFAKKYELNVLDGETDTSNAQIFISDLEQTKGFEFDRMIIINCNNDVIPNPVLPKEEWYREVSKLYVAMTRAKKDLVISYSKEISSLFKNTEDFFTKDNWKNHILESQKNYELPDKLQLYLTKLDASNTDGKSFLYHKKAVGFSRDLQNKLINHVAGKTVTDEKKKKIGWPNIASLKVDLESKSKDLPNLNRVFGPVVFQELSNKI